MKTPSQRTVTKRNLRKKCLYCNKDANSKEHVPSKSIFEKPYPSNLITVDACVECNRSFSLDEEYFLGVLAIITESPTLISRTEPGGSIYKADMRNGKLFDRLVDSLVVDDGGMVYLQPEEERIHRIIEKWALGLYLHKYKRTPKSNQFKCLGFYPCSSGYRFVPSEIIFLTHTEKFGLKKWRHLQKNVFSYIVVKDWRRNNQLTMIMDIHNTGLAVVAIPFPTKRRTRL